MAVGIAGTAPPDVLARTIGVLGRLRFADQMVLDELARGLMPGVQQLAPQQLQQLVRSIGACKQQQQQQRWQRSMRKPYNLGASYNQRAAALYMYSSWTQASVFSVIHDYGIIAIMPDDLQHCHDTWLPALPCPALSCCCQVEGLRNADHSPGVLLLDAINERLAGEAVLAKPEPVPAVCLSAGS
jgi:hypothetical protein